MMVMMFIGIGFGGGGDLLHEQFLQVRGDIVEYFAFEFAFLDDGFDAEDLRVGVASIGHRINLYTIQ